MKRVEVEPLIPVEKLVIGIAVARWNSDITERLLGGALDRLEELGIKEARVLRVPGSLELPAAAAALLERGAHGVVAIGVVIKGDTDHYDIVVRGACDGLVKVSVQHQAAVTNAILAVHDPQHALDRALSGPANKGYEAATAAVETASLIGTKW